MGIMPHKKKNKYEISDLIKVMNKLRSPDCGCPWDLEQNFKSIAPHTLEEAYEVVDAIDRDDMSDLREELGDLLFQSIYHAQIASERGHFDMHDVIHDITAKMIFRHPHVFGEDVAKSAQDVNKIWENRKEEEKGAQNSVLDGVTANLPALLKAQKLQKKAAKTGFEWENPTFVLDKLEEEIAEMREAIANKDKENQAEELGDILFLLANYARMLDINAEEALRQCNNKFTRRFGGVEKDIKDRGLKFEDVTLKDMELSWNKQKKKEKER
ncbi:MAG: nucleoside triphosphate pyrophosphohydrolase [Alphaproteobacteria bacterium]